MMKSYYNNQTVLPVEVNRRKEKDMKKGDRVMTPRFCTVTIKHVFSNRENAVKKGYTEPTHYQDASYGILGKSIDMYHMEFSAYKK